MNKSEFFKTTNLRGFVITAVIGTLAVVISTPAAAKWQFAEWGMSPDEIEKAAIGQAPKTEGDAGDQITGYEMGNEGLYSTSTHNFTTRFYYKSGRLPRSPSGPMGRTGKIGMREVCISSVIESAVDAADLSGSFKKSASL